MQTDIFKCPSCKESYNLGLHIQKVLPCQHYLCLSCLKNIFLNNSFQEPQCPDCKVRFPPTITTPEDCPTNLGLLHFLQNQAKTKLEYGYCQEHSCKRALFCITDQIPICKYCEDYGNHKGHHIQPVKVLRDKTDKKKKQLKQLLQENTHKKREAEQEIDDKFARMQELITSQFFEMRKMLDMKRITLSNHIETTVKTQKETLMNAFSQNKKILESKLGGPSQGEYDFITAEDCDSHENYVPSAEISNKLEEILSETQEVLNRFSKTIGSLKLEPTQINEISTQTIHEISKPLQQAFTQTIQQMPEIPYQIPRCREPLRLKREVLSPLKANTKNILQYPDDENYLDGKSQILNKVHGNSDGMEEEFDEGECLQDPESELSCEYASDAENISASAEELELRYGTNLGKKYTVVKLPVRRKIILELREEVLFLKDSQAKPRNVCMNKLYLLIESLDPKVYHNLLIKVLNRNLPTLRIRARDVKEWERRIQKWMKNFRKDSFRARLSKTIKKQVCSSQPLHWSSWLRKHGKETSFRQNVQKILQKMSFKSFTTLRQELFSLLKNLSSHCKEFPRLEEHTFSSSWWYKFIDDNQDIGDLWRNLPLPHAVLKEEYIQ